MNEIEALLHGPQAWLQDPALEVTLLSLLLAFVLGQMIAWVYAWTHTGLSYARSFTQSLVLITMVVSLVLHVIGDSIVTAFGLIGALAIIRFRNVLKDTRDTAFVFFALVLGMAVGSQRYGTAVLGTVVLLLVTLYLHWTSFGTRGRYDGHLTCWVSGSSDTIGLMPVMRRFCRRTHRISTRQGTQGQTETLYQVRLRDRSRTQDLLDELRAIPEVGEASLVLRDELAEV